MKKIIVNCEANDPVDIHIGGPLYLGFDFFVEDKDSEELICFIKNCLAEYKRPCLSIVTVNVSPVSHTWTKKEIENCIKEGYA